MMKIEINRVTGGYFTYFEHKNQKYYADLSNTFDAGIECMIFPVNKDESHDWAHPVYCENNLTLTKKTLEGCIAEFIENN